MTEKSNQQFEWLWRGVLVLALGVCAWFLRDIYHKQSAFNERIDVRVNALENFQAKTDGSRFTATDWVAAKSTLDERDVNLDKRITRIEDAIPAIKQSLERIENKVDKLKSP